MKGWDAAVREPWTRAEWAVERLLHAPSAPLIAGLVTAVLLTLFWGGLDMPGIIHDEKSYLVQARLIAHGMWTAPAPPLPAFWEMAHVFVEPRIFSKYPPGHAPFLVPGIWLGLQGLMPVVLAGVSAGLIFMIARMLFDGSVALLAWGIWTASPDVLRWHGGYLSQVTTTPLWLAAIVCLIAWTRSERRSYLVAVVACVGWIGITRPVTGVALGIPIGVVVLVTSWRRRSLAGWGRSAIVGGCIVALVPLWGKATLGSWTALPYIEYSRWYFPFDLPGFTRDSTPPMRTLPADLERLSASLQVLYAPHTADRMPEEFLRRGLESLRHSVGAAAPLLPLVVFGAWIAGAGVAAVGLGSWLLLVASHLIMPQPPGWSVYSLETFAVAPFFLALALVRGGARLRFRLRPKTGLGSSARLAMGLALFVCLLQRDGIAAARDLQAVRSAGALTLDRLLDSLPSQRVVVFVRRSRPMAAHRALWEIYGPPLTTDRWVLRDLGDQSNAELLTFADGRTPYLLDERTMRLERFRAE